MPEKINLPYQSLKTIDPQKAYFKHHLLRSVVLLLFGKLRDFPLIPLHMNRPTISELLPIQTQTVLDFLNQAQTVANLTDIETHRPDLPAEDLRRYSIGEQSAQYVLDARADLRRGQFNQLEEVLAVKGIGEDKVLDIVEFIWQPTEELFRKSLFEQVLGENWEVTYWRYSLDASEFERLIDSPALLQAFVADKVADIARARNDNNFIVGSLAKALLERTYPDRVEGGTALIQFASWWYRFDEDNWFSFDRISAVIDPFIHYYHRLRATYIDLVFYRGFQNGGTVASGITPQDLVVSLNPAERAITIWGIGLFD